jgi:hypothetical protein
MAKKKPSKSGNYYLQRLFEDEYIQGQLRDAAAGLRSAYGRVTKKPSRAAEDKKLYNNVRQSATSIRKALVALRRPEPEPEPQHRLRVMLIAIAVIAGSVLVITRRGSMGQPAGESATDGLHGLDGAPAQSPNPEGATS